VDKLVQGEGAADSIVRGIHMLDQAEVDVIIVGRGGGSIGSREIFLISRTAAPVGAVTTPSLWIKAGIGCLYSCANIPLSSRSVFNARNLVYTGFYSAEDLCKGRSFQLQISYQWTHLFFIDR